MDMRVLLLVPMIETMERNHLGISWTADINKGGQNRRRGTIGTKLEDPLDITEENLAEAEMW